MVGTCDTGHSDPRKSSASPNRNRQCAHTLRRWKETPLFFLLLLIMTAMIKSAADKQPRAKNRETGFGSHSLAAEMMTEVRRALWLVLGMLTLSLLLVVLGVYTTTRTESLNVCGYISGVILTLGSFLGLLGLHLEENGKQLMTAAIIFLSLGIITSFLCLLVDGICIALNMDMRPLTAGRCQYYSSGSSYIYEKFFTAVSCWSVQESCSMTVRSGTCYCCDLYNCASGDYLSTYYEFVGVQSCEEVFTLHVLIWTLAGLNLTAFFTGILTTAVLGSIKDVRSSSPVTVTSPTAPLLTNANKHTACQLHPVSGAMMVFPPAEGLLTPHSNPSSCPLYSDSQSSLYAPLISSLLPHRVKSLSV